jgi:signal transduction histidine kinase
VALVFLLQLRVSLDATLDAGLRTRSESLAEQYSADGIGALRLTLDEEPVQLLSEDGRVLASSPEMGPGTVLDDSARRDVLARGVSPESPLTFTGENDGDRTRYLATALSGGTRVILVVGTGTDVAEAADEHVEKGFLFLGPPTVLLAGLGAWWLAGAALRPVERMRRQTAELGEHDDGTHLAVPSTRDEIAALATTMNGLLDRQRDALAHERGFVADAGHELRTPLATLRAELELAGRPGRSAEDLRDAVGAAAGETDRLIRLAEDLLLLARSEGDNPFLWKGTLDLTAVVASSARGASALADPRDVDVVVEAPDRVDIPGDGDRLRQAVDNLLANAVHHSPAHGVIVVSVVTSPERITLGVADDGPGFPPDFLPHAFERFRRADTARARIDGGSGLGLAIVETIVRAHGGAVRARNRADGGALVEIMLPTTTPALGQEPENDRRRGVGAASASSPLGAPSR